MLRGIRKDAKPMALASAAASDRDGVNHTHSVSPPDEFAVAARSAKAHVRPWPQLAVPWKAGLPEAYLIRCNCHLSYFTQGSSNNTLSVLQLQYASQWSRCRGIGHWGEARLGDPSKANPPTQSLTPRPLSLLPIINSTFVQLPALIGRGPSHSGVLAARGHG